MIPESATAIEYVGPQQFTLRQIPIPPIGTDEMLVEVALCGVDGSEVHMFRGELAWINDLAPMIFGDEILGHVAAIGEGAASSRGLALGDRVVIEARWPCDGCRACDAGQYYLCENNGLQSGYAATSSANPPHLWGGYATHVFVPAGALVYRVPDELPDKTALIACSPLANGIRWAVDGGVRSGDHVVVIGPGAQGICCTLAAMDLGASVTLVGLIDDQPRLDIATRFGVPNTYAIQSGAPADEVIADIVAARGRADVVIEVAGAPSAKKIALGITAPLGRLVNVSVPANPEQTINWLDLLIREITIVSLASHPHTVEKGFDLALRLQKAGTEVGDLITDVLPLSRAEEAVRLAGYEFEARPVKVALGPDIRN